MKNFNYVIYNVFMLVFFIFCILIISRLLGYINFEIIENDLNYKQDMIVEEQNNQSYITETYSGDQVYVTRYGEFYHIDSCRYVRLNGKLKNNLKQYDLEKINIDKYNQCSICND